MNLKLVVTGSHLEEAFGNTQKEIIKDGFDIHKKIKLSLDGDRKYDMVLSTSDAIKCFAEYFNEYRPEIVVILGDRYEIFAVALAAAMLGIPIQRIPDRICGNLLIDPFCQ